MEVVDSARKHGVADEDIRHAVQVPLRLLHETDDRVLVIGADRRGRCLRSSSSIPTRSQWRSTPWSCA